VKINHQSKLNHKLLEQLEDQSHIYHNQFNTYHKLLDNLLEFHMFHNKLLFNHQLFNHKLFNQLLFNQELSQLTSTNQLKENHNSNISHIKENMLNMNKLLELNTFQFKDNTLIMKLFKELNKFQLPELTLITILLNTKLNTFHKFHTLLLLIMSHNKDHMLNKFQYKEFTLNTFLKPDILLNMFHNKDKLKMLNMFQLLNKSFINQLLPELFHKLQLFNKLQLLFNNQPFQLLFNNLKFMFNNQF
jgi:hypothetical protein